jgi:hypothetical protein
MNKALKSIGVLFTNLFICIGAGHGFGPMFLLELFCVEELLSFNNSPDSFYTTLPNFSFANSYEDMIVYFMLFSAIGQVVFLFSYVNFFKIKLKRIFRFIGISVMLFGFFLITKNLFNDGLAVLTFITGIPFLCFVFLEIKPFSNE